MGARILWLNPVGTAAFDQPMAAMLGRIKEPGTSVSVMSFALDAPLDHINFRAYEALTYPEIVRLALWAGQDGFDAMVIGCFYDHGLDEAREVSGRMIVTAPCIAAVQLAQTLANRFSVLVSRRKCIGQMTERIRAYGAGDRLASMISLEIGVEEMQADPRRTEQRILDCARLAVERDGAEAVLLGCTAEFGFFEEVQRAVGVPVLDAVATPFKLAEHLAGLKQRFGWVPSRVGSCEPPPRAEAERFGLRADMRPRVNAPAVV